MSWNPSGWNPDGWNPDGWLPGEGGGSGLSPGIFYSEGTRIDQNGVVQVNVVNSSKAPDASDVYILGTLHDEDGNMYITEDTALGAGSGDYMVNGILHTAYGVRYVSIDAAGDHTGGELFVSKGYVVNSIGRQYCVTTVSGNFDHGILRDDDSSPCDMVVNQVN